MEARGMDLILGLAVDSGLHQASLPHEEQQGKVVSVLTQLLRQQQLASALTVEHERRECASSATSELFTVSALDRRANAAREAKATLAAIIKNKDHIVTHLQQPFSCDWLPVETEFQDAFQSFILEAKKGSAEVADSHDTLSWATSFQGQASDWETLLHPLDSALASCMRFKAALQTTRQLMAELRSIVAPLPVNSSNGHKQQTEESRSPHKGNGSP